MHSVNVWTVHRVHPEERVLPLSRYTHMGDGWSEGNGHSSYWGGGENYFVYFHKFIHNLMMQGTVFQCCVHISVGLAWGSTVFQ